MPRDARRCGCGKSPSSELGMRKDVSNLGNKGCHEMDASSRDKLAIMPHTVVRSPYQTSAVSTLQRDARCRVDLTSQIHSLELIELVSRALEYAREATSDAQCENRFAFQIGRK